MYLNLGERNAAALRLRREAARAAAPEENEVLVHCWKRVAKRVGQLLLLLRWRRGLRVERDFFIVEGFPRRVGEYTPRVDYEAKGLVGKGEFVFLRV